MKTFPNLNSGVINFNCRPVRATSFFASDLLLQHDGPMVVSPREWKLRERQNGREYSI